MTGGGASAAIGQLQQHTFDLVVCDRMMRDIDGADVYEACRASAANRSARFVILTGGGVTKRAQELVNRESVLVYEKPITVQVLRSLLSEALPDPG